MSYKTFDGHVEIDGYLNRLVGAEYVQDVKESLYESFKITEFPEIPKGSNALIIVKYKWVIPNEDFNILNALVEGFKDAAGANFFLTQGTGNASNVAAGAIGLVSTLYQLWKNASNKGVYLSGKQFQIILCLKNHSNGLTFDQLFSLINLTQKKIDSTELKQLLASLQNIQSKDGSRRELVFLDNNFYRLVKL